MNESNIPAIWKWTVALLIICNIALVLTIWLKPRFTGGGQHPETPRDYVIRNLRFNDAQTEQYDALIKLHRQAMNRLQKAASASRQLLFSGLMNGKPTTNHDSLAATIANNQADIELATYDHFRQVRAICTAEQQAIFDKIIMDVIRKMNDRPPGRPREHDGDNPPHDPGSNGPEDGHRPPPGDDRQGPPPGER